MRVITITTLPVTFHWQVNAVGEVGDVLCIQHGQGAGVLDLNLLASSLVVVVEAYRAMSCALPSVRFTLIVKLLFAYQTAATRLELLGIARAWG